MGRWTCLAESQLTYVLLPPACAAVLRAGFHPVASSPTGAAPPPPCCPGCRLRLWGHSQKECRRCGPPGGGPQQPLALPGTTAAPAPTRRAPPVRIILQNVRLSRHDGWVCVHIRRSS